MNDVNRNFRKSKGSKKNNQKETEVLQVKSTKTTASTPKQIVVSFGGGASYKENKKKFGDNTVRTTKFNILTWIPLSLIIQFQRAANIYFLIISILTFLPFSPKSAISMIGTFAVVLVFTMLKDGWEDVKRYKQDKAINERVAKVFSSDQGRFITKQWQEIVAGDIIIVEKNEDIPADLLLLLSSNESGICFVDTMSLDGETNLKEKMCSQQDLLETKINLLNQNNDSDRTKDTLNLLPKNLIEEFAQFNGSVLCDAPNADLERWTSTVKLENKETKCICEMKQLLLKGCILKNTNFVIGLTVYSGHNTKIMKNAKKPPIKVSNVMRVMNYLLYSVFIFQQLLCVIFGLLYINWQETKGTKLSYLSLYENGQLKKAGSSGYDWFIKYLTFVVAYSHLIPISLYVALELVKIIQSLLISSDVKMFDSASGKSASVRTSDLVEELGQVEFIFSDKTGTLTKNEMEFRKCDINFKIYGGEEYNLVNGSNEELTQRNNSDAKSKRSIDGDTRAWEILTKETRENGEESDATDKKQIYSYFQLLALCHAAYVEEKEGQLTYQSASPDEVALISGAEKMGFKFVKRTKNSIDMTDYLGEYHIFDLICELPFDSTRKRMSVILKKRSSANANSSDPYILLTKGADSVILGKLKITDIQSKAVNSSLNQFSKLGLRTLLMGKRTLSQEEVDKFTSELSSLRASTADDKEKAKWSHYDTIEHSLEYVGCSAIEDKLQEGVAETIESLMNANIRVWVLTGDKKETAVEIGRSCKLVLDESKMEAIDLATSFDADSTVGSFTKKLRDYYNTHCRWAQCLNIDQIDLRKMPQRKKKIYMIIDGTNLAFVLKDLNLRNMFFKVGLVANSVICCRMSPQQKSEVVELTKSSQKWITLAIGDGSNDVPMIMKAHIGVGISGKEGTEAVRSADYAISQFQFLRRLLLVHGRWGYRRVSYFICYYFYKNIILVFTEFYFALYNGFSGQIFFPDMLPLCYNAFWSSWPCIFNYSLDKDVDESISMNLPHLYLAGQKKVYFNLKNFWTWIFQAIIHGAVIFFGTVYGLSNSLSSDGLTKDHWFRSTAAFTAIIHLINYKILLNIKHWNKLSFVVLGVSFIFYYGSVLVLSVPAMSYTLNIELTGLFFDVLTYFKVWIMIICLPLVAMLPDMAMNWVQLNFFPSPADFVQANLKAFEGRERSKMVEMQALCNKSRSEIKDVSVDKVNNVIINNFCIDNSSPERKKN